MAPKLPRKEEPRLTRGRARPEARFPVAPAKATVPQEYAAALATIKTRIRQERLRVVLSANAAMILLYWDIGSTILDRQKRAGWGAKIIDRLAANLYEAFPDMKGFSPRNLKYMRAFAAAWPERAIGQASLAQIPWYHHIALLEKLDNPVERLWKPAHGGRDRGGIGRAGTTTGETDRAGEEKMTRLTATFDEAIAANLLVRQSGSARGKELGHGG